MGDLPAMNSQLQQSIGKMQHVCYTPTFTPGKLLLIDKNLCISLFAIGLAGCFILHKSNCIIYEKGISTYISSCSDVN
jgi:hypothetical protein